MKIDMVGVNNGYVKVISYFGTGKFGKTRSHRLWNCICICGKDLILSTNQIRVIIPKGCCYKQERPGNKFKHEYLVKHGFARKSKTHPLYIVWLGIKGRCYRKNHPNYKYYGGKGIRVCDEWLDFEKFYDWSMLNSWKKGLVFDRIDSSKNYSPDNCQLITASENSKRMNEVRLKKNNTPAESGSQPGIRGQTL